jgi:cation diffusion facilitator family transporter
MDKARQLAVLSIVVSGLLAILKISVGHMAHSASLSADGLESASDVFTSGLVLIGLTLAARPADRNHPYGHGRVEILTGLLLGFILFLAGCFIAWRGFTGAAHVNGVPAAYAIWPLLLSVGAKFALTIVKRRQGKKIGSSALQADAANDGMDMLSGLVAFSALSLTLADPTRFLKADQYGAVGVGLIVIMVAIRVIHEAAYHLMDTMPDDQSMKRIREVALSVPDVAGVEKCFARKTGLRYHVDLHLEVDPDITVRLSHEIARNVRDRVRRELPWVADVLVHVEPAPELGEFRRAAR